MKYLRLIAAFMIIYLLTSCSDIEGQGIKPSVTTLPTGEAQKMVQELLENNAGCRLPCWWGIVPGKTT